MKCKHANELYEQVKPSLDGSVVLIPLLKHESSSGRVTSSDVLFLVEVTYFCPVATVNGNIGKFSLQLAHFDLPVTHAFVDVFLPTGYNYHFNATDGLSLVHRHSRSFSQKDTVKVSATIGSMKPANQKHLQLRKEQTRNNLEEMLEEESAPVAAHLDSTYEAMETNENHIENVAYAAQVTGTATKSHQTRSIRFLA